MPSLEDLLARFEACARQIAEGRSGTDYCIREGDDWLSTPLEAQAQKVVEELTNLLEDEVVKLDPASLERLLRGVRMSEPARQSFRADFGVGYTDCDSMLDDPLWDLRCAAGAAARRGDVEALARGVSPELLEDHDGEFLALLAPPDRSGRVQFAFLLGRLDALASASPLDASKLAAVLRAIGHELDWDVVEPTRRHYSDSGYSPSTHLSGDQPNPDNLLWFFDTAMLERILRGVAMCGRAGIARREGADLVFTLRMSLGEMAKVGRDLLVSADRGVLEGPNGYRRSFLAFFQDQRPGTFD